MTASEPTDPYRENPVITDGPLTSAELVELLGRVSRGEPEDAVVRARVKARLRRQAAADIVQVARDAGIDLTGDVPGKDPTTPAANAQNAPTPISDTAERVEGGDVLAAVSASDAGAAASSRGDECASNRTKPQTAAADTPNGTEAQSSPEPAAGESSVGDEEPLYLLKRSKPSPRRLAAQKANAAKARGAVTAEGRAASSMNRVSHGFYAKSEHIPAGPFREDPEAVERAAEQWVLGLRPVNRAAAEAAKQVARVMRREGLLDRALTVAATTTSDSSPSRLPSHEQSLLAHRRALRRWAQETITWVDTVYAATEAAQSWDWRAVVSPTLRDDRAQRICRLLNHRGLDLDGPELFMDWTPSTSAEWETVLRQYLSERFDRNLEGLAAWCESQIPPLEEEIEGFEHAVELEAAAASAIAVREVLPDITRIIDLSTKNSRSLAVAYALFKDLQALGPDAVTEPDTDTEASN